MNAKATLEGVDFWRIASTQLVVISVHVKRATLAMAPSVRVMVFS